MFLTADVSARDSSSRIQPGFNERIRNRERPEISPFQTEFLRSESSVSFFFLEEDMIERLSRYTAIFL